MGFSTAVLVSQLIIVSYHGVKLEEKRVLNNITATNLVVNIHPGTTSPAQKQAWGRFWQKIIIEVKKETGNN